MTDEVERQAERLRREADGLRDRGSWREAAAAYGAFLRLRPEDAGMRVQQAHCLKESGEPRQALALYRAAARLRPEEADIPLQIGHAEKLLGRTDAARQAYAQALALDPAAAAPWVEWLALVADRPARPAPAAGGTVLDLTDLALWIRGGRRAPSGIQRVQLGIARAAMTNARAVGEPPPRLCAMLAEDGWRDLPAGLFHRLSHLMRAGTDAAAPEWREAAGLMETLLVAPPPLRFAPRALLVTLGGTWAVPGHLAALRRARAESGLRHVPLLHDCVPLLLPEQCGTETVEDYARWFSNLALHAEGVLAVSRSTRDEMRRLHAAHLPELPAPPAAVVRMDAAPEAPPPGPAPSHPLLRGGVPFVLFVSTLEGRKDHRTVFSAWLTLLRRLGAGAMPALVCVGQPGWRAEAAMALLEGAPELRKRVHLLRDVDDRLLAALYRGSLFTVYNSLHEGWGLPVTESLAAGRAVVAPAHSALLESGHGGATFFTPGHEPELVETLARMITDPAFRAAEAARAAAVPLRSWGVVAAQLLAEAERLAARGEVARPVLPLRLGRLHMLRRQRAARPSLALAIAEAARAGEGWHTPEAWGCWTRPGMAALVLPQPADGAGPLRLELDFEGPQHPQPVEVQAWRGDAAPATVALTVPAQGHATLALELPPGAGALRAEILCREAGQDASGRAVGVGVSRFALARLDSAEDRLDLLEARRFARAEAVM